MIELKRTKYNKKKVEMNKILNAVGVVAILVATATMGKSFKIGTAFYMLGGFSFAILFYRLKNTLQVVLNVVLLIIHLINITRG